MLSYSLPFATDGKQNPYRIWAAVVKQGQDRTSLTVARGKPFEFIWASSAEPMKSQALCSLRDKQHFMAKTQLCSQRGMLRNLKADLVFPGVFLMSEGCNPGQREQESEDTSSQSRIRLASPLESQGQNSGFSFMEWNAGIEMLSSGFSLTGKLGCSAGINPGWSKITP